MEGRIPEVNSPGDDDDDDDGDDGDDDDGDGYANDKDNTRGYQRKIDLYNYDDDDQ